jgi:hypothetical protein
MKDHIGNGQKLPSPHKTPGAAMCVLLERGHYTAHEFARKVIQSKTIVDRLRRYRFVIAIKDEDNVINSVTVPNRRDLSGALAWVSKQYPGSRLGILCKPAIATFVMAEVDGSCGLLEETEGVTYT